MLALSGCASPAPDATLELGSRVVGSSAASGTASPSGTVPAARITVGLALDVGGRTDGAAGAEAARGLDRAVKDIGVGAVETTAAAGDDDARRTDRLRELVRGGCGYVVAVGADYWVPAQRVAIEAPQVRLAVVDVTAGPDSPDPTAAGPDDLGSHSAGPDPVGPSTFGPGALGRGIAVTDSTAPPTGPLRLTFADEQGAYLVGAAAALKTRTHRIGFLARHRDRATQAQQAGFVAGARAVDPAIDVAVGYLDDPSPGAAGASEAGTLAATWYAGGVDIVYAALPPAPAPPLGAGETADDAQAVVAAAHAARRAVIGAGRDLYAESAPEIRDAVLTSAIHRVDVGVYELVRGYATGTAGGLQRRLDVRSDGVGYASSGGKVDDIRPVLDGLRAKIADGEIAVPTT